MMTMKKLDIKAMKEAADGLVLVSRRP